MSARNRAGRVWVTIKVGKAAPKGSTTSALKTKGAGREKNGVSQKKQEGRGSNKVREGELDEGKRRTRSTRRERASPQQGGTYKGAQRLS